MTIDPSDSAFPIYKGPDNYSACGMNLRTYLAAEMMKALLSNSAMIDTGTDDTLKWASAKAVKAADTLITELNTPTR